MFRLPLLTVAFLLSGVAGLGYELIWTRQFALGLGHEYAGLLAVVAAYFCGFAIGASVGDGPVSRSRHPERWYAAAEGVVAVWAVAGMWLIPWTNARVAEWIGLTPTPLRHWGLAFAVPLVALLPATLAMGLTLPAMDRVCGALRDQRRVVGGLYATNTLGAALGILATTAWLVPAFGYRAATGVLIALNGLAAILALAGGRRIAAAPAPRPSESSGWTVPVLAFVTGLLGIGYEVVGIRVLANVQENTVHTFAAVLIVFLVGTALGAALHQVWLARAAQEPWLTRLLQLTAGTIVLGTATLQWVQPLAAHLLPLSRAGIGGARLVEFILATAVFGLPTMGMGALFSHLAGCARGPTGGVGRILALNTLGAACAPMLCGVILLPLCGSKVTLMALGAGYLVIAPRIRTGPAIAGVAALAAVALLPVTPPIAPRSGEHVVSFHEGPNAAVAVVTNERDERALVVNGQFRMGGTGRGAFAQQRQAHLPLLFHPHPRRALFLGLGTGVTCASAAHYPDLQTVGVELLPEVVDVLPWFAVDHPAPFDGTALTATVADARRFVRAVDTPYDVIVADLFHPARDGAAALYTREHFLALRQAVRTDGVVCQWLPLYQMDPVTLGTVLRTFLDVFPDSHGLLCYFNINFPILGLISGSRLERPTANRSASLQAALDRADLSSPIQQLGCLIADSADLLRLAGSGPLNTDDHPRVAFSAPAAVYAGVSPGHDNLRRLLALQRIALPQPDRAVSDYIRARNRYLEGTLLRATGQGSAWIDALLDSAGISPDFKVAGKDLRQYAATLEDHAATALLERLATVEAADPEE